MHLYNIAAAPVFDPCKATQYVHASPRMYRPWVLEREWQGVEKLHELQLCVCSTTPPLVPPSANMASNLNKSIAWVYRRVGLASRARLTVSAGRFGLAYIFFKWKYVKLVVSPKILKPRPLQPANQAIDAWFMSRVCKLGVLLCRKLSGALMLLHDTADFVPQCRQFVTTCKQVHGVGGYEICHEQYDVAGMYPSMPHDHSMRAACFVLEQIASLPGGHSQMLRVSKYGKAQGGLGPSTCDRMLNLTFSEFLTTCRIALCTGFVWFGANAFLLQQFGVPQGHPMSVFLVKAIAAHAVHMWRTSVSIDGRLVVTGTIFIDDIVLFIAVPGSHAQVLATAVIELFRSFQCGSFPPSCELERDNTDSYLETLVDVHDGDIFISHNIKVDLALRASGGGATLLRLIRWSSFQPRSLLIGILIGNLYRCMHNTSHVHLLSASFDAIAHEYELLGFPYDVISTHVANAIATRHLLFDA